MATTDLKTKTPEGWQRSFLSENENFIIVGSRVNYWKGLKAYLSTKSVQDTVIAEIEDYVSFNNRPSRANMQPEIGVTAFAKMGNTFKVLYNDEEVAKNYILSTGFCLVKPKIDPKYFFHFIASDKFQNNKELYCEGSTQKAISQKDYDKLEILFPENQKEQQKIAEVLTTIDRVIEKTDAMIEKNKRIKQGLMQDLFRCGIDEHGNIRNEKTHKFKTVKIGNEKMRIPEEWDIKLLNDVASITRLAGYEYSKYWKEDVNGEITTLRGFNIGINKIIDREFVKISNKLSLQLKRSRLYKNDIVFPCVGTINNAVVIVDNDKYHINQNMAKITPKKNIAEPNYLAYYLMSPLGRLEIDKFNATSSQPNVLVGSLRKFLINMPSSILEQNSISSVIIESDRQIENNEINKQKLLSLKRGLMEDLLTGKVRVNSLIEN